MKKALMICDASQLDGSGHVMRQLTLALALQKRGIEVELFCREVPDLLREHIKHQGVMTTFRGSQSDSTELFSEIVEQHPDLVVFDGYRFKTATLEAIFTSGINTLIVDDDGRYAHVPCSAILNQNLHADPIWYSANSSRPHLFVGPKYALIRPDILNQTRSMIEDETNTIFVSIGGTDPRNISELILSSAVVQRQKVLSTSGFYTHSSSPTRVAEDMAKSSIGVLACGTTVWEACFLGLPFVALITADNQELVGYSLVDAGLCSVIDCRQDIDLVAIENELEFLLKSQSHCSVISNKMKSVVDGKGVSRVSARLIRELMC